MGQQALLIIRNHPITGVGLGGYTAAAQVYIPQSFSRVNPDFQQMVRKGVVHNKYLLQAAETGIVGLVLFVFMCVTFVRACFRVRRWRDPVHFAIGMGIAAALVGQLVFFLFDHFYVDNRMLLLWITFGVAAGVIRTQSSGDPNNRRQRNIAPRPVP